MFKTLQGNAVQSSNVQGFKVRFGKGDLQVSRILKNVELEGYLSYFGSGIPSWRQILRARKSAISVCLGTVVTRRGSARLTYLLCFAPSSARTHPNRSKCRTNSRRFTYTSSCSITILFLGSLDRSSGSRIIRTASIRFSRASSSVAPCVNAPGTSSVHATTIYRLAQNSPESS